jgi:hypothetical protein
MKLITYSLNLVWQPKLEFKLSESSPLYLLPPIMESSMFAKLCIFTYIAFLNHHPKLYEINFFSNQQMRKQMIKTFKYFAQYQGER